MSSDRRSPNGRLKFPKVKEIIGNSPGLYAFFIKLAPYTSRRLRTVQKGNRPKERTDRFLVGEQWDVSWFQKVAVYEQIKGMCWSMLA